MTRLEKALAELYEAMGERPYVIVYDMCHPDAEFASLRYFQNRSFAVSLGLITWGQARLLDEGRVAERIPGPPTVEGEEENPS